MWDAMKRMNGITCPSCSEVWFVLILFSNSRSLLTFDTQCLVAAPTVACAIGLRIVHPYLLPVCLALGVLELATVGHAINAAVFAKPPFWAYMGPLLSRSVSPPLLPVKLLYSLLFTTLIFVRY